MSPCAQELAEALAEACLGYDARRVREALKKGACPNARNHRGQWPVHILIDPGNPGTDERQAKCLALLLRHGVDMGHKHQSVYTVCERISTFLPHCARAVIEHAGALPDEVAEMEVADRSWWENIFGQWRSGREAADLHSSTTSVDANRDPRRI